jgi:hypothetical protein
VERIGVVCLESARLEETMRRPTSTSLDRAAAMLNVNALKIENFLNELLAKALAEDLYMLANALDAENSKCEAPERTKKPSHGTERP